MSASVFRTCQSALAAGLLRNSRSVGVAFLSSVAMVAMLTSPAHSVPSTPASAAKNTANSNAKSMPKVLDFSAEWCVPCKKFAPTFDKVAKKYKDRVDFVHYDSEKGEGKVLADKYKVLSLPSVIFLDSKGQATKYDKGIMSEDELTKRTEELLK